MAIFYKNVMEDVLLRELNKHIAEFGVCSCDQCKSDIIAAALNDVKPKYVSTEEGVIFANMELNKNNSYIEVIRALTEACENIKKNPRH